MAVKIFNKILMSSETDVSLLKDCYFQAGGVDAAVEDGAFVTVKGLRDHDLYSGMKDMNARVATAYDASYSADFAGFVDFVDRSSGDVLGVKYRIGDKLVGVAPKAGENTRVRILHKGDEFYLGDGNFSAFTATHGYAVPTTGSTQLASAAAKPAAGIPYFAIEDKRPLIMGTVNEGSNLIRLRYMGIA